MGADSRTTGPTKKVRIVCTEAIYESIIPDNAHILGFELKRGDQILAKIYGASISELFNK